jgi:excisionase family DNA binding protein
MTLGATITIELRPEDLQAIALIAAEIIETSTLRDAQNKYLTVPEAAELLRCKRGRIDNLLSQGRLTRVKDGGRTLIARSEIEAYLADRPTGPLAEKVASVSLTER